MQQPTRSSETPAIVQRKLAAFDHIAEDFKASFRFLQNVHGQERFSSFPVADSVRYLHARWICECKSSLLSVLKTNKAYEGRLCLTLLRDWQAGNTADVVAFLYQKLDMLPIPDVTREIQDLHQQGRGDALAERLAHGRLVMLNRGMNLMHALDAIFALPEEALFKEVISACDHYGHRPEQIERQLKEMDSTLFAFVPHQRLARRNMLVMNELGVTITANPADAPGQRSWLLVQPEEPMRPYAEQVLVGYQELTTPLHNNPRAVRFVDRPERSDEGTV